MKVTPQGHIIQLDGLRFIAVALVLIAHLTSTTLPLGELGVTMFFVLSGFLISRILMKSRDKVQGQPGGFNKYLKKFLIRRTIRIFPVYYLTLFILFLLGESEVHEFWPWLVLYGTNVYMASHEAWMGSVDHLWSLAVEEQVYIFFPFLIFFVPKNWLKTVFIGLGILAVLLRCYFYFTGKSWIVSYVSMATCLDSFAFGGIMGWLQLYKTAVFNRIFSKTWLVIVGLLFWFLVYFASKYIEFHTDPSERYNLVKVALDRFAASVFCFFLIGKAVLGFGGGMAIFLENRISVYFGKISYGIYLYHNFVYNHYHSGPNHPVERFFKKAYTLYPVLGETPFFQLIVVSSLTVLVASISWHFYEKPINALKDKYAK